jgi:predicted O-linked N-acetylglucosamine transferase (SPINDLY family)
MDEKIPGLLTLAETHIRGGAFDLAKKVLSQILETQPAHAKANDYLGALELLSGDLSSAEAHLRAGRQTDPQNLGIAANLAVVLRSTGRENEALDLQKWIVESDPTNPSAHFNLGNTLLHLNNYGAAIGAYREAIRLQPTKADAMLNLSRAYRMTLRDEESRFWLERASQYDSTPLSHSNLVFGSMFSRSMPPDRVAELAGAWNKRFGATSPARLAFQNSRQPDRVLRIGYVGPTFRSHSIGLLIEPILAKHDRKSFRVFCYSAVNNSDEVTDRIRSCVDVYRETGRISHSDLARQIRQDEIDILVDVNLHLASSRLPMFAKRAAPVQVNYLAYPFTSGVEAMDFRITDAILEPPGSTRYGPETLIRLGHCFWLYRPDPKAGPPADDLPAKTAGHITFASLNDIRKLNSDVVAAWAQILLAVPRSRLLLLAKNPARQREHFDRLFSSVGVDPRRIDLVGQEPHDQHLNRYRTVDLCLDPFPYGGHTTMLDALWMGVPTLGLLGSAPYSRAPASIMQRVGRNELACESLDKYVECGIRFGFDWAELVRVRAGLRETMRQSQLCDEAGFVAEYEHGLRLAWRQYCDQQARADIDLDLP